MFFIYTVIYLCYCMKIDRICGMHGGNNGGKKICRK